MLSFRLLDSAALRLSDQPYIRKILALNLRPDFDYEVEVLHDDWCRSMDSDDGGYCNCDPDVRVVSGRHRGAVDSGISE